MTTGISHITWLTFIACIHASALLLRNKWISISTFDKKQHDTIDWRQTFCYCLVYVRKVCLSYTTLELSFYLISFALIVDWLLVYFWYCIALVNTYFFENNWNAIFVVMGLDQARFKRQISLLNKCCFHFRINGPYKYPNKYVNFVSI